MSFGRKGGGSGSGVTQTTVNNSPWGPQQGPLEFGFGEARNIYNQGPQQYFPHSTVVPFSNQTEQALQGIEATANNPNAGLLPGAVGQARNIIGGGMLNANPWLDQTFDRAAGKVQGQLGSMFGGSVGGFGSGSHRAAAGDALSNLATQLYGGNYANERAAQNQMIGNAGALEEMRYGPAQQMMGVGATREAQAGTQLQDQMSRFNFEQNAPQNALQNYMALIGGGQYGGQQQTTAPEYSNPFANTLAMGFGGVGALGTLFGQQGIFPRGRIA